MDEFLRRADLHLMLGGTCICRTFALIPVYWIRRIFVVEDCDNIFLLSGTSAGIFCAMVFLLSSELCCALGAVGIRIHVKTWFLWTLSVILACSRFLQYPQCSPLHFCPIRQIFTLCSPFSSPPFRYFFNFSGISLFGQLLITRTSLLLSLKLFRSHIRDRQNFSCILMCSVNF
jgi:hypothetical protein